MRYHVFRRAKGFRGPSDYGRVGVIDAESKEEADRLWWALHPDLDGLVAGQWVEEDQREAAARAGVLDVLPEAPPSAEVQALGSSWLLLGGSTDAS